MATMSRALAAQVALRHGIATTAALTADGVTAYAIRRAVASGQFVGIHRGVYRVATSPDTFAARCAAACLADDALVVGGVAGARIWGWRHVPRCERPILLVEHGRRPVSGNVELRQTHVLEREDRVQRPDGIRVANPVRTWFDCARDLTDDRFEMLTELVLDRHASVPTLWRMVRRLGAPGRNGSARARRVLSRRSAWQKPTDSGLELNALKALERRGIEGLVRQHPIRLPDGVTIHPDGALVDIRWALEVDHVTWHGGRFDAQRDKTRDRQLRRLSWQVDRVTDQELRDDFGATIDELVVLITLRRRELAA